MLPRPADLPTARGAAELGPAALELGGSLPQVRVAYEHYGHPHRARDGHCPRCSAPMARKAVGGRTTYWCPEEQL